VSATFVASLVVGGRLWGLVACHHYSRKLLHIETRAICELLAEAMATRIAALESFAQAQGELSVRRLERRMMEAISRDGDWRAALFDHPQAMLQLLSATGAALAFEGQVLTAGEVPSTPDIRAICKWLDGRPPARPHISGALGQEEPDFARLASVSCGLVAMPISTVPGEYLVWFRPELVRTVTWGGNPFKAVVIGDDPADLSPRRSFAKWHQLVEGSCEPWTPADVTAARLLGESVADVVLQFRAVRFLIAQDQLAQASRLVRNSDLPVVVADPEGRIVLSNEAFEKVLMTAHRHLRSIEDIAQFFEDGPAFRQGLVQFVRSRRSWRTEVKLRAESGRNAAFLVRADPVLAPPQRLLGFVLLFTDLSKRKAVDSARRRLQEEVFEHHRTLPHQLSPQSELMFRNLLTSIVANAQLAAFEITDGGDAERMPEFLESVRDSVTRTADALERLVWLASRSRPKPP
jgi:PAS domain-containing protein